MIERDTVICSLWTDRVPAPMLGNQPRTCEGGCKRTIAVGRATRRDMPSARLICGDCARREVPAGVKAGITPGVRREITALTGKDPQRDVDNATVRDILGRGRC